MPKATKRQPGRPKLPKGKAKGRIVPVRFSADGVRKIELAARFNNEKVSEWIRRSLEEAQVVKLMVRIVDRAENVYDWFIGPPQECPPIPRVGEQIECGVGTGTVNRIEHAVEEINTKKTATGPWNTYYKTLIHIG